MTHIDPVKVRSRSRGRMIVRWIVPIAIFAAFLWTGHIGQAISALGDVNAMWAVMLILVGTALPLAHAFRWTLLMHRTGEVVPRPLAVTVTALASLLNYAAPGFLGAPAKAVFVRERHGVPISRTLPTLAVEQLLDALLLLLVGSLAFIAAGPAFAQAFDPALGDQLGVLLVGFLAAGSLTAIAFLLVRRLRPGFIPALRLATSELLTSREHQSAIVVYTVVRWVLDMSAVAIASIAVGLRLSLLDVLLLANLALLAGLIAPVPGGLGIREAVMAAIAGVLGVSIPLVLALSVLHRAGLAIGLPIVLAGSRIYEWGRS